MFRIRIRIGLRCIWFSGSWTSNAITTEKKAVEILYFEELDIRFAGLEASVDLKSFMCEPENKSDQCCGSGMFIPDPDFYPSRIPDPKTVPKERDEKKFCYHTFF